MAEQGKIPFGTDVAQLLDKMNGISHGAEELFLLELVRLAVYRLYQMRFRTMYDEHEIADPRGLFIDIIPDKSNHTLAIVDNGIGMTEDDLMNFFTIPPDDYEDIIEKLKKKDINIDEFYEPGLESSLGIFAPYMVADKVQITTKHYDGQKQNTLSSSRDDGYFFIESVSNISGQAGTKVTLELDESQFEYLNEFRLKALIDKFTFRRCPYQISIRVDNIIIERSADVEEKNKDKGLMMEKFEGLRMLFREVLGRVVDEVIVCDRVYDFPSYLADDGRTLGINPRNYQIEKLREAAERNAKDEEVVSAICGHYVRGRACLHRYRHSRGKYQYVEIRR